MDNFRDLQTKPLIEIVHLMANAQENSPSRGFYMAEIIRRQTKAQIDAANVAKWSILVACIAIVVAAAVQITTAAG